MLINVNDPHPIHETRIQWPLAGAFVELDVWPISRRPQMDEMSNDQERLSTRRPCAPTWISGLDIGVSWILHLAMRLKHPVPRQTSRAIDCHIVVTDFFIVFSFSSL
jgi:hypothetical protein